MKVLHTSDWHLGKRLPPFNREREQKAALLEIRDIAQNENADVCIIAGDVFDVSVPPATAEELFYNGALEIAKICPVVAITTTANGSKPPTRSQRQTAYTSQAVSTARRCLTAKCRRARAV